MLPVKLQRILLRKILPPNLKYYLEFELETEMGKYFFFHMQQIRDKINVIKLML